MRVQVLEDAARKRVPFEQFETGDLVVAPTTGFVGIKTEVGDIVWISGPAAGKLTEHRYILANYFHPTSAVVTW